MRLHSGMKSPPCRRSHRDLAPSILNICFALMIFQMSSASEHTSNFALLRSIFVENLDLLVVASEDNNICKYILFLSFESFSLLL